MFRKIGLVVGAAAALLLISTVGYFTYSQHLINRFRVQDTDSETTICGPVCDAKDTVNHILDCTGKSFCLYSYLQTKVEIYCPPSRRAPDPGQIFAAYPVNSVAKKDLTASAVAGRFMAIGDTKDVKVSPLGDLSIEAPNEDLKLQLCAKYLTGSSLPAVGPLIPLLTERISQMGKGLP